MTINHIDQMHAWWQEANDGIPKAGDTIIADERHKGRGFYVYQATKDHPHGYDNIRVLHRAPAPKPAWHDAVAVIAHTARFSERRPFALTHTEDVLDPYNTEWITRDDLIDPAPLIEAKVTDEMRKRVGDVLMPRYGTTGPDGTIDAILTAALGLETE